MSCLTWLTRLEAILCGSGFVLMAGALMVDVGARLTFGHGVVGAAQLGLVGMLVTALFGVGLVAHTGEHLRPRLLDAYRPPSWEAGLNRVGHALTALFFALLAGIAAAVAFESHALRDLTSLLRWPVWLLQSLFVVAFGCNALRVALFALRPHWAPLARAAVPQEGD